jgi:hypothetical protein
MRRMYRDDVKNLIESAGAPDGFSRYVGLDSESLRTYRLQI